MSEPRVRRAEIAIEQAHVDRVYTRLDELKAQAEAMRTKGYEIGQGAQREAIFEQASMLFERDMMVHHANQTLQTLDAEYEGLVFGRLDDREGERTYVGRLGIRDAEFDNLVTDWRAPAAAAFYQATAEEPMDVVRRRVIRCSGQNVLDVDDDVLIADAVPEDMQIVGEGALMAALGRSRGEKMRDIVATIQKEQDEVIRAPWRGVTEITGGPGTGKTAVALHRAAYLLYRYRRQLGGAGVLVIGPSGVFTSYISRVLPSMGETNVELRALGEVLDGLEATRQDAAPLAAVKGSLRMRKVLLRALRDTPPEAPEEMRIVYRGEVLKLNARELEKVRRKAHTQGAPPNRSRIRAAEMLLDALAAKAEEHAKDDGRQLDRAELITDLGERIDFHRFLVVWWPVLYPAQILKWLADEKRLASAAKGVLNRQEISMLAADFADRSRGWSIADVALLDELRVLIGPEPKRKRRQVIEVELQRSGGAPTRPEHYDEYSHVVVDESQDLSPMQWRMVGRRGKYASWTVVGDPVQSSWPDPAEAASARDQAFGVKTARRRFTLRTNYRNSAEIFDLAAKVVAGHAESGELPVAVRRTGVEPEVRPVEAAGLAAATQAAVKELLGAVEGTVGVITAMDRVPEVAGWLPGLADERLKVVGSLDSKGLEYDAVVLVEPVDLITESTTGRRVLYVALTRATQQLIVLASNPDWIPAA
ncbi:ATP-dependent DNA helicase [Amycolatopsis mediterranei S699]|uniref:ATP-dependent DNA helicase n=2 Tax=Amycolatopsis mediterranei TaxID=33910 RepID=A0A0H3CZ13_AMYMU|nr:ATP-binding domain-containing protein [Amycolatopsis mediterranei]ADJ43598.1 ATP-dependent DNA helicase [Amycolatopsis mediterranei U32]AEK40304.1 ATP-dependent DNA helicase [Amycolatopsis mediterranei S699]AFO75310.1 ATP-dependent DNA helicase [Amycolatopsis mediterranei S699]AGT82439.1 ATP-dependent DNA helicase [Amycolatopsis mediterranei RB]KDO03797.1 ATP-dependent DNA helicase [Amycolatopsis mediterranei]